VPLGEKGDVKFLHLIDKVQAVLVVGAEVNVGCRGKKARMGFPHRSRCQTLK
jgi:hypothetical protein